MIYPVVIVNSPVSLTVSTSVYTTYLYLLACDDVIGSATSHTADEVIVIAAGSGSGRVITRMKYTNGVVNWDSTYIAKAYEYVNSRGYDITGTVGQISAEIYGIREYK